MMYFIGRYDKIKIMTISYHRPNNDCGGHILKRHTKQFLIIAFILAYLCFGIIISTNSGLGEVLSSPLLLLLLVLGFLSPFLSSLIVFILNKEELGGLSGFIDNYRVPKSKESIIWVFIFLAVHYGLGIILNNVGLYGDFLDFFKYLPIMIILLGSQELGWRRIVQPFFEKERGYYRSIIITGLFWAVWFMPLIFIRGFIVLPQFYTQFAAYLIGLSFLLTALYKKSQSILYCTILSSLIFALVPVIVFKVGYGLLAIALFEAIVVGFFKK